MNDFLTSPNWTILLPSFVTFFVVIFYKKAVPSLLIGILTSIFILNYTFDKPLLTTAVDHSLAAFASDGGINWDNIFIILFLWLLGVFISILNNTSAIGAISDFMNKNLKTVLQTKLATFFLGLLFFIDDYFNSLAIGAASRNLYDKRGISREKLAYYLDSTAAPVCILVPISSWGAVIVNILDNTMANLKISSFSSGLDLFFNATIYNFYPFITLIILLIISVYNIDFPKMALCEREALSAVKKTSMLKNSILSQADYKRKIYSAFSGIISLFFSSIFFMVLTGYLYCQKFDSFIDIASNIELGLSLLLGVCVSIIIIIGINPIKLGLFFKSCVDGLKNMAPAIQILILAWIFSFSMSELKVGVYISSIIQSNFISASSIPIASFVIAGIMSLLTGTSWVTFSILIPIVCEVCLPYDSSLISISVGAVLAGSVFGDHSSPISDTSILSATGAGCDLMKHVSTQLPYCLLAGALSFIGYIIIGVIA